MGAASYRIEWADRRGRKTCARGVACCRGSPATRAPCPHRLRGPPPAEPARGRPPATQRPHPHRGGAAGDSYGDRNSISHADASRPPVRCGAGGGDRLPWEPVHRTAPVAAPRLPPHRRRGLLARLGGLVRVERLDGYRGQPAGVVPAAAGDRCGLCRAGRDAPRGVTPGRRRSWFQADVTDSPGVSITRRTARVPVASHAARCICQRDVPFPCVTRMARESVRSAAADQLPHRSWHGRGHPRRPLTARRRRDSSARRSPPPARPRG